MKSSSNKLSFIENHQARLPSNCMPIYGKKSSSKNIYKLIELNNSIQQLMDSSHRVAAPRKRKRESLIRNEKSGL
jgi:hypothetical protein